MPSIVSRALILFTNPKDKRLSKCNLSAGLFVHIIQVTTTRLLYVHVSLKAFPGLFQDSD